jgi:hypothetical protein
MHGHPLIIHKGGLGQRIHPPGHWTKDDGWRMRVFFDQFACINKFDPKVPENWYRVTYNDIVVFGGEGVLKHFGRSHVKALCTLYPSIGIIPTKFRNRNNKDWTDPCKRRQFFDDFAKLKQFNPLEAEHWGTVTRQDVISAGGRSALYYYRNSHITALISLYPETGLHKGIFVRNTSR